MGESKLSFNLLFGGIFFFMGLLFFVLGVCFGFNLEALQNSPNSSGDMRLLVAIFSGIGALFMIIGAPFMIVDIKKKSRKKRLLRNGNYIMATVTEVVPNTLVTINGRNPYYLVCEYVDPFTCVTHVFKSGDLTRYDDSYVGKPVKIYVEQNNMDSYYVDVNSVFGDKVFH